MGISLLKYNRRAKQSTPYVAPVTTIVVLAASDVAVVQSGTEEMVFVMVVQLHTQPYGRNGRVTYSVAQMAQQNHNKVNNLSLAFLVVFPC